MSAICNILYRVQILRRITPSKATTTTKNEEEKTPHKKQNQQTKQIRMMPVTFNMLYLILCKCPELIPDL